EVVDDRGEPGPGQALVAGAAAGVPVVVDRFADVGGEPGGVLVGGDHHALGEQPDDPVALRCGQLQPLVRGDATELGRQVEGLVVHAFTQIAVRAVAVVSLRGFKHVRASVG